MKIFQVINVRWYNATAWYAVELANLLHDAGHRVLVIGIQDSPPLARAKEMGLATQHLDLNSNNPYILAKTYANMRKLVRMYNPDIVNCHRGESFFLWGLLRKHSGTFKLIRTRGDQRPPKNTMGNRWLHNHAADAVILTNTKLATYCRDVLGVSPKKLWTIYGGVDVRRFRFSPEERMRVRREFGYGDDDFVIGLVGRFDKVKGQYELLKAVANLRQTGLEQLRVLLVGHDSALPTSQIQTWIQELGLEGYVRVTGRRDDVPACIAAMDVGVVASLWSEAIARAALEIMACDRPLISTDVGVMPDLLDAYALCPPGDVDAMQSRIARAVGDTDYRQTLCAHQKLRLAQLTSREFLRQTLNVYQSVLSNGHEA